MNGLPGIRPVATTFNVGEGGNASGIGKPTQRLPASLDVFKPSDPDTDPAITAEQVKLAATEVRTPAMVDTQTAHGGHPRSEATLDVVKTN